MRRGSAYSAALLALALLPAFPGVPLAQELQDGVFTCTIGSFTLGDIAIAGGKFAGPAYDGKFEGWYPLTTDGQTIVWGGPLGGISAAGEVVATVIKKDGNGSAGFDITLKNKDSGNFQTISCARSG